MHPHAQSKVDPIAVVLAKAFVALAGAAVATAVSSGRLRASLTGAQW